MAPEGPDRPAPLRIKDWKLSGPWQMKQGRLYIGGGKGEARLLQRRLTARNSRIRVAVTARGKLGKFVISLEENADFNINLTVTDQESQLSGRLAGFPMHASVSDWHFESGRSHRIELRFEEKHAYFLADGEVRARIRDAALRNLTGHFVIRTRNLEVSIERPEFYETE